MPPRVHRRMADTGLRYCRCSYPIPSFQSWQTIMSSQVNTVSVDVCWRCPAKARTAPLAKISVAWQMLIHSAEYSLSKFGKEFIFASEHETTLFQPPTIARYCACFVVPSITKRRWFDVNTQDFIVGKFIGWYRSSPVATDSCLRKWSLPTVARCSSKEILWLRLICLCDLFSPA